MIAAGIRVCAESKLPATAHPDWQNTISGPDAMLSRRTLPRLFTALSDIHTLKYFCGGHPCPEER